MEPEVRGSHGAICNHIFGRAPSVITEGNRHSILEEFGQKFGLLARLISRASDPALSTCLALHDLYDSYVTSADYHEGGRGISIQSNSNSLDEFLWRNSIVHELYRIQLEADVSNLPNSI